MPKRNVLLIAYHFPPIQGSSGVHRTVSFARYLPEYLWQPTVLTVHPRAYPQSLDSNALLLPDGIPVLRAFALDVRRHLSLFGRYPRGFARPDRWSSWIPFAVWRGIRYVREHAPRFIMATFPIVSALFVARLVSRFTGVPWIADLRDPLVTGDRPGDSQARADHRAVERTVVTHASRIIVTTPGARQLYQRRYPDRVTGKIHLIENGVDDAVFDDAKSLAGSVRPAGYVRLLHSGIVYLPERDPRPLFETLAKLKSEGVVSSETFRLTFRASGVDDYINTEAVECGIPDLVETLPATDYKSALTEIASADGLLLLQGEGFNAQIPAKAYEYLYSGKPILALTDPRGDTGQLIQGAGSHCATSLHDRSRHEGPVRDFLMDLLLKRRSDRSGAAPDLSVTRKMRTQQLAGLLDEGV